jgi:hypothetical protein
VINPHTVESSHPAKISRHSVQSGQGETHKLPNQTIRLILVSIQLRAVKEKLTRCRIKPSGSHQSPSIKERSGRISQAVESSHRAQISCNPAQSGQGDIYMLSDQTIGRRLVKIQQRGGQGETHQLSNQAIGLKLVAIQH